MGRATDVVVGGITPVLVESPRRCSRMVERVALQVEDGVETLADSPVVDSAARLLFSVYFLVQLNIILHIFFV